MSRYRRSYDCADCGTPTVRIRDTSQALICSDCTLKRLVDSSRQLAAKSGPYYDQWLTTNGPKGRPPRTE